MEQSQPIATDLVTAPQRVRQALVRQIRRVLQRPNGYHADGCVERVSVPVPALDAFRWLRAQPAPDKLYWSGRDEVFETAGVGVAHRIDAVEARQADALAALQPILRHSDPEVGYLGGLRFDPAHAGSDEWSGFTAFRFVLPRFELRRNDTGAELACNLFLPRDRDRLGAILDELDALVIGEAEWPQALAMPVGRDDHPDAEGWRRNVEWALEAFEGGAMEKVVLARKAVFHFDDPVDPLLLLANLKPATPHCFHFCFQLDGEAAFIGASPERLFRRESRAIRSEAVAGTRPRGASDQADARLRDELLHSEKDLREHAYVRESIARALAPFIEQLDVDAEPSLMPLARGRHLVSRVRGCLRQGVSDLDVLERLHPTPAVGGHPTPEAVAAIRDLEPFDRGWYAGPVGWVRRDAAEFAVAIRSGLVRDGQLALFSGAGIVTGSTPDGEWDEIEHKISDFINVLGLDLRRAK